MHPWQGALPTRLLPAQPTPRTREGGQEGGHVVHQQRHIHCVEPRLLQRRVVDGGAAAAPAREVRRGAAASWAARALCCHVPRSIMRIKAAVRRLASHPTHLWLTGLPTMPNTAVSRRCRCRPYMPLSCCSVGWPGAAARGGRRGRGVSGRGVSGAARGLCPGAHALRAARAAHPGTPGPAHPTRARARGPQT